MGGRSVVVSYLYSVDKECSCNIDRADVSRIKRL